MRDLFPTSGITSLNIESAFSAQKNRSQSGQIQTINLGGQYWVFKLGLNSQARYQHDALFAFLCDKEGSSKSFRLVLPVYSYTKGKGVDENFQVRVKGSDQVGRSVTLEGLPANIPGVLLKGDYIRFDGQPKVYLLTEDLNSDSLGEGILSFVPRLIASPVDQSALIFKRVDWQVILSQNNPALSLDLLQRASWTIHLEEAF